MVEQLQKRSQLWIFIKYHLPVILYAGAIITVSSIPNLKAPQVKFVAFDKVAHFFEYAIFAFLTFRSALHIKRTITVFKAVLLSALFLSFFALLDEYYQHFVPGRQQDMLDYATDVGGALFVLALLGIRQYKSNRKMKR